MALADNFAAHHSQQGARRPYFQRINDKYITADHNEAGQITRFQAALAAFAEPAV